MYKLIIFDLDGTLLNSIEDLANSVNYTLQRYNLPTHPVNSYKLFIGNGVNKLIERALPENLQTTDQVEKLKQEFIKHYNLHSEDKTTPYEGIETLLSTLQSENFKIAIASNKFHEATVALSKKYFPTISFFEVLGQREGFATKPDPTILNEIINKAGVENNEVLYVGDSGVDASTARNANVDFVGVLWGFRTKTELEQNSAKLFAIDCHELYTHIKKLRVQPNILDQKKINTD